MCWHSGSYCSRAQSWSSFDQGRGVFDVVWQAPKAMVGAGVGGSLAFKF
jgi:hypothetical protein